ncbi:MAG: hypothetical protein OXE42_16985 [Gammaproteobacteria bacterium]|nr:hypothetical protein [Gammaproteobacteria bacterium]
MSPELIGIISVGAGLAVLFVGLFAWLRQDMKEQGRDLRNMITEQGKEIEGVKKEIGGVKIEVASLRATVETYFRVRVDPPRTAAVAEAPEDYGAD